MINLLKPYKWQITIALILGILVYIGYLNFSLDTERKQNVSLTNKYEQMNSNYRASKDNSRKLVLTIGQLKESHDYVLMSLDSLRKKIKVKDNKITELQWYKDHFKKGDTIKFHDTIFVKNFKKDTVVGDKHYSLSLKLRYPSTIQTSISVVNEKSVISYLWLETVEPRKHWPWWWFQKKQLVEKIEVVDSNPYITNKDKTIVKIIDPKTFKEKK